MSESEDFIKSAVKQEFDLVGISKVGTPQTIGHYETWLNERRHGDMKYLERHLEKKRNPLLLLNNAKSWISMASFYDTSEPLSTDISPQLMKEEKGWVSRYARGGDYHLWIEKKHEKLISKIKKRFPAEEFLSCVDSKAVLERDVASAAGLGWIGKNTCLINTNLGSFIFLSEILTTLALQPDKAATDHCGTCSKCIESCPTGAIVGAQKVDATLCISYWTIESKKSPPRPLSEKFGVQVFGCDICQDVCPWNKKSRRTLELPPPNTEAISTFDLRSFVRNEVSSVKTLIQNTALERAGPAKLLTNAEVSLSNLKGF